MDFVSHQLFAESILTQLSKDPAYKIWANEPDLDYGDGTLLHRYRLHRFSAIPDMYNKAVYTLNTDKDAISLSIISHIYADTFNGFVFPYDITHPALQNPKIFWKLIQNPIKNINAMSDSSNMPLAFFMDSRTLFNEYSFGTTVEEAVASFINILSKRSGVNPCIGIETIVDFTNNIGYRTKNITDTTLFEEDYSNLVTKYLDII